MFHVVLVEPEIPPNTGNVARLCLAADADLHLVRPLGFSLDDRYLRRAGMDYWPAVRVTVWDDWEMLWRERLMTARSWFLTTKTTRAYTDAAVRAGGLSHFWPGNSRSPREPACGAPDGVPDHPDVTRGPLAELGHGDGHRVLFEAMRQARVAGTSKSRDLNWRAYGQDHGPSTLGVTWEALCADSSLAQNLPYKIETNGYGQIVMSPTSQRHNTYGK